MDKFSEFIVFADESGDHGMENIDPGFPIFALVFCIFAKDEYTRTVEPAVRDLKFRYFGHDAAILHERDIRRQTPPFDFLRRNSALREEFHSEVGDLIQSVGMQVVASIIDKERHRRRYTNPWNPYQIAMHFCLEALCAFMIRQKQHGRLIHVVFESRGKAEDAALELEFRRITDNRAHWGVRHVDFGKCRFEPLFVPKAGNHSGHQIADLIARPLALRALRPTQSNRAAGIAMTKLEAWKVFP